MQAQLVLAEPALSRAVAPVTQVRSTLLSASLVALRKADVEQRYFEKLDPRCRERITSLVPGSWVDVELAVLHYRACDSLGLSLADVRSIALAVAVQVHASVLSTLSRLAKMAQATPWLALEQSGRLASRVWNGGGVQVWRLGPKEARLVFLANPLMAIPYFHASLATNLTVFLDAFATKVYVRTEERGPTDTKSSLRIAWA